jgi:hypothetical protein
VPILGDSAQVHGLPAAAPHWARDLHTLWRGRREPQPPAIALLEPEWLKTRDTQLCGILICLSVLGNSKVTRGAFGITRQYRVAEVQSACLGYEAPSFILIFEEEDLLST